MGVTEFQCRSADLFVMRTVFLAQETRVIPLFFFDRSFRIASRSSPRSKAIGLLLLDNVLPSSKKDHDAFLLHSCMLCTFAQKASHVKLNRVLARVISSLTASLR